MMEKTNATLRYRTLSGITWAYIGKFSEFFLLAVVSIMVGRILGPDLYGRYNLFTSVATTIIFFASFGFDTILNRFVPQLMGEGRREHALVVFSRLFLLRFSVMIILGATVYSLRWYLLSLFGDNTISVYGLLFMGYMLGMGLQNLFVAFFNSLLKVKVVAFVSVLTQVFNIVIMSAFFLHSGLSLDRVLVSVVSSVAFSVLLYIVVMSRSKNLVRSLHGCDLRPYLSFGFSVWQVTIWSYAVSATLNVLLMGVLVRDPLEIGLYSTAVLFSYFPGNLLAGWSSVILPSLSEVRSKYGLSGMGEAFVSFGKVIILFLIPTLLFMGCYARPLVIGIFGNKFAASAVLLQVYCVLQLLIVLVFPHLGVNSLYALNKEKTVLKIRFIAGLLNILLIVFLAPSWKSLGVMLASCIVVLFQTFTEFAFVWRSIPVRYPVVFLFKVVLASIIALLGTVLIPASSLAGVVLAAAAFALLFLASLRYFKLLRKEDRDFLLKVHPFFAFLARIL
jgi:O-antigen/teichoic acid export membrane protein